jgi:hypothetical protein
MAIRSQDLPGLQMAIDKAIAKERGEVIELPKQTWIARFSFPFIRPIKSADPVAFKAAIDDLQKKMPQLTIYLFVIEGV